MNSCNEERGRKNCRRREEFTGKAGICSDLRRVGKGLPDPNPKPRSCGGESS
jgi:hypothetical protein